MTKKVVQDMVQPEKRSIRSISIDKTKRNRRQPISPSNMESDEAPPAEELTEEADVVHQEPPMPPTLHSSTLPPRPHGRGPSRKWLMWVTGLVVLLILLVVLFSVIFSGAEVRVTPRQETITVDAQFSADKEPEVGDLSFDLMSVTRVGVEEVGATGESHVDRKASGRIIVFNDFDSEPQRFIKNTRFETPEGLIYRIDESVVVPGQTTNESGQTTPGSIEVTVFADTSGVEYNVGLTDFTIPGLEDDPDRFGAFFARSKTPMSGGFSGIEKTALPEDVANARGVIEGRLTDEVLTEARSEVPEGYILYDDALFIDFEELPNTSGESGGTVLVRLEATLYGLMFNEEEYSRFLASNTLGAYEGEPVRALDALNLSFGVVDKTLIEPSSVESFDFTLEGKTRLVWSFDEGRLKEDLSQKSRGDVEMVLSGYPAILNADISLRPFWRRSFPSDVEDIDVEQHIDEQS